jgi:hypothetical protein
MTLAPVEGLTELRSVVDGIAKNVSRLLTEVTEEVISLNFKMSLIEDYLGKKAPEKKSGFKPEVKTTPKDEVLFEVSPELLGQLERFVPQAQ